MRNVVAVINLLRTLHVRADDRVRVRRMPPKSVDTTRPQIIVYVISYAEISKVMCEAWTLLTGIIYICQNIFANNLHYLCAIFSPVASPNKTTHGPLCARVTQNSL